MATPSTLNFALRARKLQVDLRRDGVPLTDMRGAAALELQFAGASGPPAQSSAGRAGIEPIEGPIEQRRVEPARAADTKIGFFLDGAQRTLSHCRVGIAPVTAVVAAVGIVQRNACEECTPAPGSINLKHVWLVPGLDDPHLDRFRAAVLAAGMEVRDPLIGGDGMDEPAPSIDYTMLQERAYAAAKLVRQEMEAETLAWFRSDLRYATDARWLVVDGLLKRTQRRAIGVVKQFSDSYLSGRDEETLLALPPGHRTTAFVPDDRWRAGPTTLWYLRLWPADGLDARHALIRVEVAAEVHTTAEIDEISSWLLAERTPRATGDERWATLLYPIHHLERMLKRAIDAQTRGW
ncbi:MAG: hypothetical protein H0U10_06410 [Chloroflexia bacterium]|nr:hypothetical protein [Chloroflexia bacterium]